MKASEMIEKIKDLLGIELSSQEAEAIELAQTTLENGAIIEYESLEAGSPVFIVTEDEKIALPAGEYTLEDGRILLVVDEGEISEVKEATEEDQAEEEEQDVEASQDEEMGYVSKDEFDALKKDIENLMKEHDDKIKKLEEHNEKKAKDELSKIEVESEPVYHSPEKKTEKIQMLSQNRPLSTQDIVFKKLYS